MYSNYDRSTVLLVGFDPLMQKRLHEYIMQTSSASDIEIMALPDDRSAIDTHFKTDVFYNIIFINTDLDSTPVDALCRTISHQFIGSMILVSDYENDVLHSCVDHGATIVLRKESLSKYSVKDAMLAAKHNFDLRLRLKLAERRFSDMVSNTSDWLWEIDLDLNYVYFHIGNKNQGMYNSFQGEKFYKSFLPDEEYRIQRLFKKLFKDPQPFQSEEFWGRDLTGKICWSVSGVPVYDLEGRFVGYRGISRNISAEKDSQNQVYWLGNHDPITGLFNQTRFYSELSRVVQNLRKYEREGVLAIIDIDQFKLINSQYNNEVGDRYLVHIGNILKKFIRQGDIVSRITSDKFSVMMPEISVDEAKVILDNLVKEVAENKMSHRNVKIAATISVGLVGFPEHGINSSELVRKAEVATTRAKEKGRNRIHVFNPEEHNDSTIAKSLEMIDFISDCLENDRLVLYYQPIVLLSDTNHVARYEVLMRMIDRQGNIVPPAELIQAAEDFGMHTKIDTEVATKAIEQAKRWYHEEGKRVVLAINLSGLTFDDDELIAKLGFMVKNANLPKGTIVFEITETAALRDLSKAQNAIADLKRHGCYFALDDFGTGYSSFHYVKNLDVDFIKIDGSFIRNITNSSEDHVFVKALYNVANEMKIKTIAEMVEDLPTAEMLNDIGIDYAQGYYFGKPKPTLVD
jgi:diguanylate cyclase (GGDEF)-like protein|tara:strand:- start:775 stop:2835 length:2061 start_codon:yes stop_codon:yes gene_type:complete